MQNPLASLSHRERFGLAVAVGVLLLFGLGSAAYRSRATPLEPTVLKAGARPTPTAPPPLSPSTPRPTPAATELVVYVSGAVKRPGVYTFRPGQRLFHAIQRAGGFQSNAQQEALNLADHLKDADQLHVPTRQAVAQPQVSSSPPGIGSRVLGKAQPVPPPVSAPAATHPSSHGSAGKFHTPGEGLVKLNNATLADLQKLPGVGPSTAQSILDYRQSNGGFKELEELKEVRGIGEKKLEKMRPFLTL
ncbi:helix-hairpin-helix domain-containing protein [Armatimonas rosea]|uniref:Competence protein ComEA n=1 Tax=Armatimonas rosea TaxID=685828 RepID=A0A7W9SRK9_ARMRO|nr:helix-hairpin-helix domain-containing protein [Armatimonas rosea]MBB6050963.1 competence protein ComEA [Armatimonas rosea]